LQRHITALLEFCRTRVAGHTYTPSTASSFGVGCWAAPPRLVVHSFKRCRSTFAASCRSQEENPKASLSSSPPSCGCIGWHVARTDSPFSGALLELRSHSVHSCWATFRLADADLSCATRSPNIICTSFAATPFWTRTKARRARWLETALSAGSFCSRAQSDMEVTPVASATRRWITARYTTRTAGAASSPDCIRMNRGSLSVGSRCSTRYSLERSARTAPGLREGPKQQWITASHGYNLTALERIRRPRVAECEAAIRKGYGFYLTIFESDGRAKYSTIGPIDRRPRDRAGAHHPDRAGLVRCRSLRSPTWFATGPSNMRSRKLVLLSEVAFWTNRIQLHCAGPGWMLLGLTHFWRSLHRALHQHRA